MFLLKTLHHFKRKPNSMTQQEKAPKIRFLLTCPTSGLHSPLLIVPKDKKLFYTSMPLLTLLPQFGNLLFPTPPLYRNISLSSLSRVNSHTAFLSKYSSIKTTLLALLNCQIHLLFCVPIQCLYIILKIAFKKMCYVQIKL